MALHINTNHTAKSAIRVFLVLVILNFLGCSSGLSSNYQKNRSRKTIGAVNRYTKKQDGHPHPSHIPDLANISEPKPKYEPKSRYGNSPNYTVFNKTYSVLKSSDGYKERGYASWYGTKFHGFRTSSGEVYDMYSMTAAHKTLPLPTYAKITNLHNKHSVIVKINDRGPFHGDRIIDLSYAAASKLGIIANGVGVVEVTAINPRDKNYTISPGSSSTLQLGAFIQESNAKNLVNKLEEVLKQHKQNYKINIVLQKNDLKKTIKENILYKVVISSVNGELNVKQLKKLLSSMPVQDAIMIN
jgi:rare lipoprotein A